MQIIELAVGESVVPAKNVRITVLRVDERGVRLQVEAPAEVRIEIKDGAEELGGAGKVTVWPV